METVGKRRRVVVVWKIVAQVLYVPAVFQCWGEGLRWWAEGAEVFQPVANPTGAHNCVVAYTPVWWTWEEASWCSPKYARGNSTAVAASSQAVHRTAEAVLTSLRYSHSANSTTSLMSCTFDLWWQLHSSCLKLPHLAAVIWPREVPPASNLTVP